MTTRLSLSGRTPLDRALAAAATRAGVPWERCDPGQPSAVLVGHRLDRQHRVELDSGDALLRRIVEHALDRLCRLWSGPPERLDCHVLAPAGGVTGPAGSGPVDAVRVGPAWQPVLAGRPARVQVLVVQHTRCWLASCLATGGTLAKHPDGVSADVLPPSVAGDTARVAEHMQDRGAGDHWPLLALLGPAHAHPDGAVGLLMAFTEGSYAQHLIEIALPGVAS